MKNSQLALSRIKKEHDVRRLLDRFETFDDQIKEKKIRIKMLLASGDKEDARIAKILARCKKDKRCDCAACPICSRRYRIRLIGNEMRIFGDWKNTRIITLIISDRLVASSDLLSLDIKKMMRRLTKQIERSDLKIIICIGGFEIKYCYNRGMWIPHFHLIVKDSTYVERQKFRRRFYKTNENIYRPMKVQKIKNPVKQCSYCLKYFTLYSFEGETKEGNNYKKSIRLKPFEHNLYLRFMARHHVKNFVFKRGTKSEGESIRILR